MEGDAVAVAGAGEADAAGSVVAATAVSVKRTVLVEVDSSGYVMGVRFLDGTARDWDSETLEKRVKAVAAVAHDRYLAGQPVSDGRYPTLEAVAIAESELDF